MNAGQHNGWRKGLCFSHWKISSDFFNICECLGHFFLLYLKPEWPFLWHKLFNLHRLEWFY